MQTNSGEKDWTGRGNDGNNSNGAKAPTMPKLEYESSATQSFDSKLEGQSSSVREKFEEAFDAITTKLRKRRKEVTKFERILQLLIDKPTGELVSHDEVRQLFLESDDPDDAAWVAIFGLNHKLKDYNLRIERPRAYQLILIDPPIDIEAQALKAAPELPHAVQPQD